MEVMKVKIENFNNRSAEIEELKARNAELIKRGEDLANVRVEEVKALTEKYEKLLEEKEETLKATHKTEIDIISTKMQEETNLNQVKIEELEKQVERLKYDVSEAERLRDIVDAECDKLESELEETKVKMEEMNTTQESGRGSLQPSSLQSTMVAGQQTLLNNVSMDCTFIPAPDVGGKIMELEKENLELQTELNDVKRQLASTPTEEKYVHLKSQLIQQKEYNDKIFEDNQTLKNKIKKLEESVAVDNTTSALQKKLADVKEELGKKNIEYASLKVDVEKGELEYKRRCEILQADLDYEKSNSTRLTQEIRRYQASAMDTTVIQPKAQPAKLPEVSSAACNTSVTTAGSPVWSSGSGAIKEIRLHNAEMRVKTLEKENVKLKEHEEFYINKAREWKSRALKYERTMEQHGVIVPGKENKKDSVAEASNAAPENNAQSVPVPDAETAKVYQAAGLSPRTKANPLQDLQNLRTEAGPAPPTPTEDIKLVLSRRSEPRRTEADFRLPEDQVRRKVDDCKTQ